MSLTTLRTSVKRMAKINSTDLDTLLDDFINEAYRKVTRKFQFPELIVRGVQQALTAGTETYALPEDFFRMMPNGARLYSTTYTTQNGLVLGEVLPKHAGLYENMADFTQPIVYTFVGDAETDLPTLQLLPQFTGTGLYLYYDYYSKVTGYTDSDEDVNITDCEDYLLFETLRRYAVYNKDFDSATEYEKSARQQLGSILVSISNQTS